MSISINQISNLGKITFPNPNIENKNSNNSTFQDFYKSAMEMFDETNQLQKDAEKMSIDLALGKTDNLYDVMIAQEKASTALQYTVSIRDAVLDAYNEIMRMQV